MRLNELEIYLNQLLNIGHFMIIAQMGCKWKEEMRCVA